MIQILAPAKLNLGLEILGKRTDGYHEIRTVLCAVSLFDWVAVAASDVSRVNCTPIPGLTENLAGKALDLAARSITGLPGANVSIAKRIPAAAGLGGASSDAAATLIGLNCISGNRIPDAELAMLARSCGSDVPFFLQGGLAFGTGRGDVLEALPTGPFHAVLIVPNVTIPDKTRTMYGRIRQSDWSDGSRVDAIASAIRFCAPVDDELLANAFQRALYDLLPEVKEIADSVTDVLNRRPHLSGAGPAMYVLCRSARDAGLVRNKLRTAVSREAARIYKVRSVAGVLIQERSDV